MAEAFNNGARFAPTITKPGSFRNRAVVIGAAAGYGASGVRDPRNPEQPVVVLKTPRQTDDPDLCPSPETVRARSRPPAGWLAWPMSQSVSQSVRQSMRCSGILS